MANWDIISVLAIPDITCISSTGRVIFPTETTIWDPTVDFLDNDAGSKVPVTFRTPLTPVVDYKVSLRIVGTCAFPEDWTGGKYILSALASSYNTTVLQSEPLEVPQNASRNVVAENFLLLMPCPVSCPLPFRWTGDFTWTITLVGAPQDQDILFASKKTRLELCWARAPAPNGPINPRPGTRSRTDLTPGYPIGLFRLFSPCPTEFATTPSDLLSFYIKRAMNVIWDASSTLPRYDTVHGASYYNMTVLGGNFNLDWWVRKVYLGCNCYDLAGIAQLACAILVDDQGNELVDSNFVWQFPNGYVNPGPLFGWGALGGDHLRCNSPFWASRDTGPYVDPASPNRSQFYNHAWVEITNQDIRGVLDATHALQANPTPQAGKLSRIDYLFQTIDTTRSKIDASTRVNNEGACWINPDTQLARIGVTSASGAPNPDFSQYMALPEEKRKDLELALERGKSPHQPDPKYNTTRVSPDHLISKLFPRHSFNHTTTAVSVKPSAIQTVINVHPTSTDDIECLNLTISTFDDFEKPISALTSHLLGFQSAPLSDFVFRCDPPLGAFSFNTTNSIFWVRGNQFIYLQESDVVGKHPSRAAVQDIAVQLDDQLSTHHGNREGLPNLSLDERLKSSPIYLGQTFTVPIPDGGSLLREKYAESADSSIVLAGGPSHKDGGELEFYAVGVGSTFILIHGADEETFRPVKATMEVKVLPAEIKKPWA